jgi:FAD synthetase
MKTKIFASGTFDILHTGHVEYFKAAKALKNSTHLTIIVARDSNSTKLKNKPTINSEKKRLKKVKALKIADQVILGSKGNPINSILKIKPDIIALGHDQWAKIPKLKKELKKHNLYPVVKRMPKFKKIIIS